MRVEPAFERNTVPTRPKLRPLCDDDRLIPKPLREVTPCLFGHAPHLISLEIDVCACVVDCEEAAFDEEDRRQLVPRFAATT